MNGHLSLSEEAGRRPGVVWWLTAMLPLVAVYLIVLVSLDPWDIAIGAVLAAGFLRLFRRFVSTGSSLSLASLLLRVIAFFPFALIVVRDILIGTWQVAVVVLGLRPLRHPGIITVPVGDRSRFGVAISALVMTLSPGSVLVDIDWEKHEMLVHVIDGLDPDKFRTDMERFYQRYQRHVFP